jgi:hypothetical protein
LNRRFVVDPVRSYLAGRPRKKKVKPKELADDKANGFDAE